MALDNHDISADDIIARVPAGTIDFAAMPTIPEAGDFHFAVGARAKERHRRALRDRRVDAVRDLRNVEIRVPKDPARYGTIASFRLRGTRTNEDAQHLQHLLFERYRVGTVWRNGLAAGPVIRVTPASTLPKPMSLP